MADRRTPLEEDRHSRSAVGGQICKDRLNHAAVCCYNPNMITFYFIALGSNIRPYDNAPLMLDNLLTLSPTIDISPIIVTEPVGMPGSRNIFLNLVVRICSELSAHDLKEYLKSVEIKLGRDRSDPLSKVKDRVADMDVLFELEEGATAVPAQLLPDKPYDRPQTLDLLNYLGLAWPAAGQPETLSADLTTAELTYRGRLIGSNCATIQSQINDPQISQIAQIFPI
jgi:2-amino-4-hydroxy-6-hydroxymethyldihydropteridine diphosphokinase